MTISRLLHLVICLALVACKEDAPGITQAMQLTGLAVGTAPLNPSDGSANVDIPLEPSLYAAFSSVLDGKSLGGQVKLKDPGGIDVPLDLFFTSGEKAFLAKPKNTLSNLKTYSLELGKGLRGAAGETFPGLTVPFTTIPAKLSVTAVKLNQTDVTSTSTILDVGLNLVAEVTFSNPLADGQDNARYMRILDTSGTVPCTYTLNSDKTKMTMTAQRPLRGLMRHSVWVSYELRGQGGEAMTNYNKYFFSAVDPNPVFPVITDDELLTKVQQQTFKYFWDYAEPVSGMSRERNGSGDLVTSGGSGFGLMSLVVGIERGFITRAEGVQRFGKMITFLEKADRFHGVWSHWINGATGKVIPFSGNDNGGDLVETSYLVQGLITVRQYLNPADAAEASLISRINALWESVEWDWYRRDGQQKLYWHWSADKGWIMNMPVTGWNECLITYVLAASSPGHGIPKTVYDNGWALNGGIRNGATYEGVTLPLGSAWGGPLFFSHYSFLGLKPQGLSDAWCTDYFQQNRNHTLINRNYCIRNPKKFLGYSEDCWGLTASDNQKGYDAHSPTNDLGVITPTAAISALPYTPEESMKAIRFFYYSLGDRLWGDYGFKDAINLTESWTASSFLAIDQGPIIVMIENHRTGLLWNLFMSAPEVQAGLDKLGFQY
ncbi:MAG: glucoamylase family protein [Bacteroidota bacterium]